LFEDGKQIIFETHPYIKLGFAKAWAATFEAAKREKRAEYLNPYLPSSVDVLCLYLNQK